MTYLHAQIIKVLESRDRLARVDILLRDDGRFEYRTFTWMETEDDQRDQACWSPVEISGLYDTIELADRDASRFSGALGPKSD